MHDARCREGRGIVDGQRDVGGAGFDGKEGLSGGALPELARESTVSRSGKTLEVEQLQFDALRFETRGPQVGSCAEGDALRVKARDTHAAIAQRALHRVVCDELQRQALDGHAHVQAPASGGLQTSERHTSSPTT